MSALEVVAVAVLAVGAIACKSSDGGSTETKPNEGSAAVAAAGKVLEVSGQVTVGGKPLTVGAVVQADDLITTGADGRVTIELTHNLAHWQLGPGKQQKVSESIAWKLPRSEGNAKVVIQDMTSAGRPAERSAGETAASAHVEAPSPAAPPASVSAPAAIPKTRQVNGTSGAQGGGAPRAERQDQMPTETAQPELSRARGVAPTGPSAKGLLEAHRAELVACLNAATPNVQLAVRIGADGSAKVEVVSPSGQKVPDAVGDCLRAAVAKLSFPKLATEASTGPYNLTLDLER
jgi:hypothetical protein